MAAEVSLSSAWTVLETEIAGAETDEGGIDAVPTGTSVAAGSVLVGLDRQRRRYVLVPLRPGEAFAEDRRGRAVHLIMIKHGGQRYLAAQCLQRDLDPVFQQFAEEVLRTAIDSEAPAQAVVNALANWRRLLSDADRSGMLGERQIIGLMAELLTVAEVLQRDPNRRLEVWTGPSGHQHDLLWSGGALEVKATLIREGRLVPISSVDQLDEPPGASLHLVHHRFEMAPDGSSLPDTIDQVRALGVDQLTLDSLLAGTGYSPAHEEHYRSRRFRLVDRHVYDVVDPAFPRIIPTSFLAGRVPDGTLRLSYTIDLTNTPPHPIAATAESALWERAARS
jgi:hypothetical protein